MNYFFKKWIELLAWPEKTQYIVLITLAASLLGAFYVVDTLPQKQQWVMAKQQNDELHRLVQEKQVALNTLKENRAPLDQEQSRWAHILQLIPDLTDASSILEEISQKVLESGLELESFRMMPEQAKGFYKEIPIDLSVVGNYQELAAFMPHLSQLPRIITIHDFNITPISAKMLAHYRARRDKVLIMRVILKSYQYIGFSQVLTPPADV